MSTIVEIKNRLNALFGDSAVSQSDTRHKLEVIQDHIQDMLDALPNTGNKEMNLSPEAGMPLRDYIAVKALVAIIALDGIQYSSLIEAHAKWAYEQADAMIAVRESKGLKPEELDYEC